MNWIDVKPGDTIWFLGRFKSLKKYTVLKHYGIRGTRHLTFECFNNYWNHRKFKFYRKNLYYNKKGCYSPMIYQSEGWYFTNKDSLLDFLSAVDYDITHILNTLYGSETSDSNA